MAKLDEIVRQKDPELKQVVDDLAHGRVREAVSHLEKQGRAHEIPDRNQRYEAIARDYGDSSGRTLVVAPDNQSRLELNDHIRHELKDRGVWAVRTIRRPYSFHVSSYGEQHAKSADISSTTQELGRGR